MRVLACLAVLILPQTGMAQGLSKPEIKDIGRQVSPCWNIDALHGDAATTVVSVRFELDRLGKPLHDSFALIGAGKDTSDAVKSAYGAAKRAIIRCGGEGYKLPLEKYDHWRNIELTFNPERMSLR